MSLSEVREGEQRLTVETAHQAIGRWVRVVPGETVAILLKVTGTGLLVRYAGNAGSRRALSHYANVSLDGVRLIDDRPYSPDWLYVAVTRARDGQPYPADLHGAVTRVLHPEAVFPRADDQVVYTAYKRERGEMLDGDERSRARLVRIFESYAQLEARYLEDRELEAELDAQIEKQRSNQNGGGH